MIAPIGALVCGTASTCFLWKQMRQVEKKGSQSISVASNILVCGMFVGFSLYAAHTLHFVLIATCIIRLAVYVPFIGTLWRVNGGFNRSEWEHVFGVLVACVLTAVLPEYRDVSFIGFHGVGALSQWKQIRKLWQEKSPGQLNITLQWIFCGSCLFWCILGPWLLTVLSSIFLLGYCAIIGLWYYYSRNPRSM